MEIELIIKNLENPTAFKKIKKRRMASSDGKIEKYDALHQSSDDILKTGHKKHKDFDWRAMNRFVEIPKPEHKFVKKDYLTEERIKKGDNYEVKSEFKKNINWDQEIGKNL